MIHDLKKFDSICHLLFRFRYVLNTAVLDLGRMVLSHRYLRKCVIIQNKRTILKFTAPSETRVSEPLPSPLQVHFTGYSCNFDGDEYP